MYLSMHGLKLIRIENIKIMSIENVSTGVLDKNEVHYLRWTD